MGSGKFELRRGSENNRPVQISVTAAQSVQVTIVLSVQNGVKREKLLVVNINGSEKRLHAEVCKKIARLSLDVACNIGNGDPVLTNLTWLLVL